jgi:hypothetical protein
MSGLGNLAQSARSKQLRGVKSMLISIGLLTAVVNFMLAVTADATFARQVKKLQDQGKIVDPKRVDIAKRSMQVVSIGFAILGIVYIVMGSIVETYPVPITILAFLIYLGCLAVNAVMIPLAMSWILIIKLLIAIVLAASVQTAIAYERSRSKTFRPAQANPWSR